MNREQNTGVLPPEEEAATFENVNLGEGGPQGNAQNAVSIPASASAVSKVKRQQSAAQQATMQSQAVQRAKLKEAGAKNTSVSAVATLARLMKEGDMSKYNTAFEKAVSGVGLGNFRAPKPAKTGKVSRSKTNVTARVNSAVSLSAKGRNSASQTMPSLSSRMAQTNMRGNNMVNTNAMNTTIDSVLAIADGLGQQVNELKRMIKTLKKKAPRASTSRKPRSKPSGILPLNSSAGLANALPPLSESVGVNAGVGNGLNASVGNGLLDLPPAPQAPAGSEMETLPEVSAENNTNMGGENEANSANSAYTPPP